MSPEKAQGSPESEAASGENTPELLMKFGLGGSSSKTSPNCEITDLSLSCKISARSGMMRNGTVSQLPTLALLTAGTASGSWRTPGAQDGKRGVYASKETMDARLARGGQLSLPNQVKHPHLWPSPTAQQAGEGPFLETLVDKNGGPAQPGARAYNPKTGKHVQVTLNRSVKMWPTPTASMHKGSSPASLTRKTGASRENDRLDHKMQATEGSGQLNPTWVEWLMGFPEGYTEID